MTRRTRHPRLAAAAAALAGLLGFGLASQPAAARPIGGFSPPIQVSQCRGQNAEVEEAVDHAYVYDLWIGCSGIGFARSTDGGRTFDPSLTVPGSVSANPDSGSWDPAIAVAPNGTVYAAFMFFDATTNASYPVVAASFDHGATFTQVSSLPIPPFTDPNGNWGDRDFIAVDRQGTVYVTWDYGPSASEVQFLCSPTGSCGYSAGDLNVVVQKSTDGRSWTRLRPISPGFPASGGDSAPLVIQPDGTIDVVYQGYPTNPKTLKLGPGGEYFTRSVDGGQTWSAPVQIGPSVGTESLAEWWIDGDIATDRAGNLYATWDTQSHVHDIGWLSYSTDGGTSWSHPIRVTPGHSDAEELVEVTGAGPGVAYVGWQSPGTPQGYATFVRPFSIQRGWLTRSALQVSSNYGNPAIWPGDTFGIATLDRGAHSPIGPPAVLSWGSAIHTRNNSEIFSSVGTIWPWSGSGSGGVSGSGPSQAGSASPQAPPPGPPRGRRSEGTASGR